MKNTLYLLKNATSVQMQSFIVTDESGKLLVIDGGNTGDPCIFWKCCVRSAARKCLISMLGSSPIAMMTI